MARRASDLLDAARDPRRTCAAALGPAAWACGTTSRDVEGRPRLAPRALAAEVARRSARGRGGGRVRARSGAGSPTRSSTLCQAVCTIPTTPAYDSMNLAQAVAVLAYEVAGRAARAAAPPRPAEPARHATVEALWDRLRSAPRRGGLPEPAEPGAHPRGVAPAPRAGRAHAARGRSCSRPPLRALERKLGRDAPRVNAGGRSGTRLGRGGGRGLGRRGRALCGSSSRRRSAPGRGRARRPSSCTRPSSRCSSGRGCASSSPRRHFL